MIKFYWDQRKKSIKSMPTEWLLEPENRHLTDCSQTTRWKVAKKLQMNQTNVSQQYFCTFLDELTCLQNLSVCQCDLQKSSLRQFCQSPGLAKLLEITLFNNNMNDSCYQFFFEAKCKNVQILKIKGGMGNAIVKKLARANWKKLKELSIERQLGNQDCDEIIQADWPALKKITLDKNSIDSYGLKNLHTCAWQNITLISLRDNKIDHRGMVYIKRAQFKKLSALYLQENLLGDQGIKILLKADYRLLTILYVGLNNFTIAGFKSISQGNWPKLDQLNAQEPQMSIEHIKSLMGKWPLTKFMMTNTNGDTWNNSDNMDNFVLQTLKNCYPQVKICYQ